jgi:N5-(cytidine 5'-diphosphoramidyl)-L-glutamine hydrolase
LIKTDKKGRGRLRLCLTMRSSVTEDNKSRRDWISPDWFSFLELALPEAVWTLVPNLGENIEGWLEEWSIDGVILTGGEDIGVFPIRDRTESAILDASVKRNLPVLGICRGCQVIAVHFSQEWVLTPIKNHIKTRHQISFVGKDASEDISVNSYHRLGIERTCLGNELQVVATAGDGDWVEALRHRSLPIEGMMWHPEREELVSSGDIELFQKFFRNRPR